MTNSISSFSEYQNIVESFTPIPYLSTNNNNFLGLESTIYFWVRLRGYPGNLRVEYRPFDMNKNWENNVNFLLDLCKEEFDITC